MRIKYFFALVLFFSLAFKLGAQGIEENQAAIMALGPRDENSAGEAGFFALAKRKAESLGYQTTEAKLDSLPGRFSSSQNLYCLLADQSAKSKKTLYVAVPVAGNSFALALTLSLMENLARDKGSQLGLNFCAVFLGAERSSEDGRTKTLRALGSEQLADALADQDGVALVYLSPHSESGRLVIRNYSGRQNTPAWLVNAMGTSLGAAGFGLGFSDSRGFFLPKPESAGDPLGVLLSAGVPACALLSDDSSGNAAKPEPAEFISRFERGMRDCATSFAASANLPGERHYLVFASLGRLIFVHETQLILFIILSIYAIIATLLGLSISHRREFIFFFRGFLTRLPSFLAAFFGTATLHLASVSLIRALGTAIGGPRYWEASPQLFLSASLGLFLAFLLIALLFSLRAHVLPTRISFYGAGAALLLLLDVFVFATIHLYYALFFVWLTLFAGLAILIRKKTASIVCLLVSLLPLVMALANLSSSTSAMIRSTLLRPSLSVSLRFAFICLPVLLLVFRLILQFFVHFEPSRGKKLGLELFTLAIVGMLFLSFPLLARPYSAKTPIPLTADLILPTKGKPYLTVSGWAKLEGSWIEINGERFELGPNSQQKIECEGAAFSAKESLSLRTARFLGRKRYTITLTSSERPCFAQAIFAVKDEFDLYDCNYPYEFSEKDSCYRISLGANPSLPLTLTFTVPEDFSGRVLFETSYIGDATTSPNARLDSLVERQFSELRVY
jgi:hypothetical protein